MLIVVGWKMRFKATAVGRWLCPVCEGEQSFALVEGRKWFTLFWVPVFKYGASHHGVHCHGCGVATTPEFADPRVVQFEEIRLDA
jgi:hypothetical protein